MNEYQNTIDNLTKEYQKKLAEAKHYYDWSMEYHTKELERINESISKLLHKTT